LKTYLGQPDIAIRHFKRAIRLAPAGARNAHRYIGIGSACFDAGRYHEAARWKRKAVLEDPGTSWVNRTLAVSYSRLGDRRAALDSLDALRRLCPDVTIKQVVNAVSSDRTFWIVSRRVWAILACLPDNGLRRPFADATGGYRRLHAALTVRSAPTPCKIVKWRTTADEDGHLSESRSGRSLCVAR
jgi:tetratricopeptide (TPR) repeat protein